MDIQTLDPNELRVLRAVAANAVDTNGGDFAFGDQVVSMLNDMTYQEVDKYLRVLQGMGLVTVHFHLANAAKIALLQNEYGPMYALIQSLASAWANKEDRRRR